MTPREQMLRDNTPIEKHPDLGLFVKREDLACREPGPQFSKTRGVFAHMEQRYKEGVRVFGALDTFHSQAGHAVARACQILGAKCVNYYPEYKNDPGHRPPQSRAQALGAELVGLPAGMSAVLFHQAKRRLVTEHDNAYMMPNALKLDESVRETAKEVTGEALEADLVIIPVSSATIAAGVIKGFIEEPFTERDRFTPQFVLHMGYSRSKSNLLSYIATKIDIELEQLPTIHLIDEGYNYKDKARNSAGVGDPPFPCSPYYDLKAYRWWMREGRERFSAFQHVLLWNIG